MSSRSGARRRGRRAPPAAARTGTGSTCRRPPPRSPPGGPAGRRDRHRQVAGLALGRRRRRPARASAVEHRAHRAGPQRRGRRRRGRRRWPQRPRPAAGSGWSCPTGRMSRSSGPGRRRPPVPVDRAPGPPASSTSSPAPERGAAPRAWPRCRRPPGRRRRSSVPSASAAHTSARLVRLFEPGTVTVASSGRRPAVDQPGARPSGVRADRGSPHPTSTGSTAGR